MKKILWGVVFGVLLTQFIYADCRLNPDATRKQCIEQGGDPNSTICKQATAEEREAIANAIKSAGIKSR